MRLAEVYGQSLDRLIGLARELDERELDAVVIPTPLWTVADVYRHLLGVAADILEQNLEGRGTAAWTDAQVQRSAHLSVPEVCALWAAQAAQFEAAIEVGGAAMTAPCFVQPVS